jgi:hypothetical protein
MFKKNGTHAVDGDATRAGVGTTCESKPAGGLMPHARSSHALLVATLVTGCEEPALLAPGSPAPRTVEDVGGGVPDAVGDDRSSSDVAADADPESVLPLFVMTHPSGGAAQIQELMNTDGLVGQTFAIPAGITSPHGLAIDAARDRLLVSGYGDPGAAGLWAISLQSGAATPFNTRVQGQGVVVRGDRIFAVGEERFIDDAGHLQHLPLALHELDQNGTLVRSRTLHRLSCALDLVELGDDLAYTCDGIVVRLDDDGSEEVLTRSVAAANGDNFYAATRFDETRALFVSASGAAFLYDGALAAPGIPVAVGGWITAVAIP